jgi:hypothetical protein
MSLQIGIEFNENALKSTGKELSLCQKDINWMESLFEGNSLRATFVSIFALLFALLCR